VIALVKSQFMAKERARKIKVILFDVDGVLTDGTIWLFPSSAGQPGAIEKNADGGGYGIQSATVIEAKGFNAHDGTGITLARIAGLKTGMITKRISETVALRARDLKIDFVYQGQADKSATLDKICAEANVTAEEIAFVGDDIIDLPVMRRCGLAIAVSNAREAVKDESHFVTDHRGGEGAARDAIEFILRAQGRLESVINSYISSRPETQRTGKNL
jgi:3-deoxy-D-manno-octulosonate 8-phosphate phosphatase (KDO 8-P phosphatase)